MKHFFTLIFIFSFSHFIHAQCNDLFISEYVEGWSNNKALEIYNPTANDIILNDTYDLVRYSNGAGVSIESDIQYVQPLTGIVPAYSTFIAIVDRRDPNGTGVDTILFSDLLNIGNTFANADFYSPDYNSTNSVDTVFCIQFKIADSLGVQSDIELFF